MLRKITTYCVMLILMLQVFMPPSLVQAATDPKLNKKNVTLEEGETFRLELENFDFSQWNDPSYTSSAPEIVNVSRWGVMRALQEGTATIFVSAVSKETGKELSLQCKATVKNNGCSLSASELDIYQEKSEEVTFTCPWPVESYDANLYLAATGEKIGRIGTDIVRAKGSYYYTWHGMAVKHYMDGKFILIAKQPGDYLVELVGNTADGKSYTKVCTVHALPLGLEEETLALAVGKSKELVLANARDVVIVSRDPGIVSVDGTGKIHALAEGETRLDITFTDPLGRKQESYHTIYVTNPVYVPLEGVLPVLTYKKLNITGISSASIIYVNSSDASILGITKDGNYLSGKAGTATLTIEVDGVEFQQTIKTIDPQISPEQVLLLKGKTKTLKVTGADKNSVITYTSSDPSVAKVSKTGKITAKKAGVAAITVDVDGGEIICSVTVLDAKTKGSKAVWAGEKVLGAPYSQEKRMQEGYYDCSSFVWRMYKAAGVKLGGLSTAPTAAELAKKLEAQGKVISYEYLPASELKPGDLIFYGYGDESRYMGIYHVSMFYGSSLYYNSNPWYGEVGWQDGGLIIHASGEVHIRSYSGYTANENLVMIVRPY